MLINTLNDFSINFANEDDQIHYQYQDKKKFNYDNKFGKIKNRL